MSPSQNPGGPFKGFTPHNAPAPAAPRQQPRPVAAVATAKSGGGSNTLSIVALILAVLGLGCPLLGLTGAILGIVAMRTQPNGMALASVIVGSLTTLVVAIVTILMYTGAFRPAESTATYAEATDPTNPGFVREATMAEAIRFTELQANDIARFIASFEIENGRLPESIDEATARYGPRTDGWGTPYKLSVEEATAAAAASTDAKVIAFILTAGPDRTWGTADDYVAASSPYVNLVEYGMKTSP